MTKYSFPEDLLSQRVIRFVLIFELAVLLPVVILAITPYAQWGLCLAFPAVIVFWGIFLWTYGRYQSFPFVKEKIGLERQAGDLKVKIRTEAEKIALAPKLREKLQQAEQAESGAALHQLQAAHIRNGLVLALIDDAKIPGVGPKLKERLAAHRIASAADVNPTVLLSIEGFGEAKRQALLTWRNEIHGRLDRSKPLALPAGQADEIKQKFAAQHEANQVAEREAGQRKLALENELGVLQPGLRALAPLTFRNYLWHIVASQRVVASITVTILVVTQICLVSSAGMGALVVSIPTVTPSPTIDISAVQTAAVREVYDHATQTALARPTFTSTFTSTFTITPTETITLTQTNTETPTRTTRPTKTLIPVVATVNPGGGGGGCDPAYPTVCIPPPPPDLNCDDIPYRNFKVLSPDPHGFDRDHDGIGCES